MTVYKLTPAQAEQLSVWRYLASEKMPYMSRILFALSPVSAPGIGTFAVDDRMRLYVDFGTVETWGNDFCAGVLLHECSHILAGHADLAKSLGVDKTDPYVWNIAADASINDDLRDADVRIFEGPNAGVLPEALGKPDYLTAPEYLGAARNAASQQQEDGDGDQQDGQQGDQSDGQGGKGKDKDKSKSKSQSSQDGKSNGDQKGGQGGSRQDGESESEGSGQGDQDGESDDDQQDGQGGGSGAGQPQRMNAPAMGCGSCATGVKEAHELSEGNDLGGEAPAASDIEIDLVRVSAAQDIKEASKTRGLVPAGLEMAAEVILTPSRTPWRKELSGSARRAVGSRMGAFDVDRRTVSRRRHNITIRVGDHRERVIYPGYIEPKIRIGFIRDTSASMSDGDLNIVASEVEGIAKQLGIRGEDFMVMDVDASAYETRNYRRSKDLEKVEGRGGTDMCAGIEKFWSMRKSQRPSVIVVATDGGTGWPAKRGPVPVIACLVGEYGASMKDQVPSWIRTIVVENPSEK